MNRPTIRKILLKDTQSERMIQAIKDAAPEAELVVATSADDVDREIADTQVLIGGRLTDTQLQHADQLVWHHVPWVGVEGILTPAMLVREILLTNGSGVNSANIAEHVVAMMLAFARDLPRFVREQDQHSWRNWNDDEPQFFELGGQKVLCLGTGEIGQEVARRLSGFGCEVIGASRSGRDVPGFLRCVSFEHLTDELADADHIVSSLPMTEATDKIVDREMIAKMKQGAIFYNVGRGGTVDQDALIEALQRGHLAAAGLDVVTPEPLHAESPLWTLRNVIITSHTSGNSPQAQQRMADLTAEQIQRFRNGEELINIVDQTTGY